MRQPKLKSVSVSCIGNILHGWALTYYNLVGNPRRYHFEVLQRRQDTLDIAEHGGEPEEEQHDEEQDGPHLRARHW